MYPMCGWKDSYSHPRNQMVYPPYHTQGFEAVPPHMKMDPVRPAMFEPWPYGGNSYGYSYPTECHGCCNHNNYFPGHYGFRPPYPHFPPPSPQYYHGSYPAFFGGYSGYQIPPPHYSMEKPRYEYDKGFSIDQHCCGCPNHSCKKVPDKNVENEEREMDINKKSSGSLVPSNLSDLPSPFVMIPPGYQMDPEGRIFTKSEGKEDKKVEDDVKCDKSSKSLKQEKETLRQQDLQSRFPFPIFWLPYKSDEVEKQDQKGMSSGHRAVIAPLQEKNEEVKDPSSESGPKMIANGETQVTTPVKKAEHVEEKKKGEERNVKAIPVLQADDNQEKGSAGNGEKKVAPSPKSSKLPPVCLRVDPVSKPKKGNGISRSPSPPADKGRSRQSSNENIRSSGQNERSQNSADKNKEESRNKTIYVVEGTATEGKTEAQTNYHHALPSHEEVSSRKSDIEGGHDVVNQDAGEAIEREEARLEGQMVNKEEDKKVRKKMMSDVEAVLTIQSVYRGYEVRKSEPLKKLRQIAEVTQKLLEVKDRISALDSCSDVEIDEKQLVAIGETIMSLLLKLDTIQGLNPCVRDIRKSVAKELVSLQEKLDSLTTRKKAQASIMPPSSETPEGPTVNMKDNVSVQNNQNEAEVVLDGTQVGGIETDAQLGANTVENGMSGTESFETSEPSPISSVDEQRTSSEREMELGDQKNQVPNGCDDQMTAENEESLEPETSVCHADDKADNGGEVADSTSLVQSDRKVCEVAESINLPQGVPETTDTPGDLAPSEDPIVEDLEVDTATDYITPAMDQLGNLEKNMNGAHESELGPEEMSDEESRVKDVDHMEKHEEVALEMEPQNCGSSEDQQVQTETSVQEKETTHDITEDLKETNGNIKPSTPVEEKEETNGNIKPSTAVEDKEAIDVKDDLEGANIELSTPMQEKGATDITDDVKEACIALEPVTQVVEDRVHDGETDSVFDKMRIDESDETAPLSPEEDLTKELSMKNDMLDQPQMTIGSENPGKVDIENGSGMVSKGVDRDREVMEENMRLKETMEKLIEAGNEQLATITKLSGKVKVLEKKLNKKSKLKTKKPSRGRRQDMVLV